MGTFTMSQKELQRPGLLKAVCAGRITNRQAAAALGLSVRQVQRLKRRFEAEGPGALRHRSRGRPSPRRLPPRIRHEVARLMTTVYVGFNDTHLTEKLHEEAGLPIGRESVRRIRGALGLRPQRVRRAPRARRRRIPEAACGALIQVDGSPFAWLEERGPAATVVGAVDDATSAILALHFRPTEDLHGYMSLFRDVFTVHGLPLAVYGDRLNLLVRNDPHWSLEEQLAGTQFPTHLGRVLQALGVGYIAAHSPQAKGRVERLWATLQDRLVSELRVRRIATLEDAQAYVPAFIADYNRRFAKPPASSHAVWRRPPRNLSLLLGCRYRRLVGRDNTVQLGPRWVQLRGPRSYAGLRIDVHELLDGRLVALHDGIIRGQTAAPSPAFTLKARHSPSANRRRSRPPHVSPPPPRLLPKTHTGRRPLPSHPWIMAAHRDRRRREQRREMTLSRSSEG
jgi:transposase